MISRYGSIPNEEIEDHMCTISKSVLNSAMTIDIVLTLNQVHSFSY